MVSAYSGLAEAAFRRLPESDQFLNALSATGSRYANATDPDTAFATDIRGLMERYPSSFGNTARIQRGFGAFAQRASGLRMSTAANYRVRRLILPGEKTHAFGALVLDHF